MSQLELDAILGSGGEDDVHTPIEADDTIQSRAMVDFIDLIGEGQIGGLIDGEKSILIDGTPLQNADGSYNFQGVTTDFRDGRQDQTPMSGFREAGTAFAVNVQVKQGTPYTFTVDNIDADRVRVIMGFPALFSQNKENGDINGVTVEYKFAISTDDGPFVDVTAEENSGPVIQINDKTRSKAQRQHTLRLPKPGSMWKIRVTRLSADDADSSTSSQTFVDNYVEIVDTRFSYPNSAVVGIRIDSSLFNRIPPRAYWVAGIKIKIPSNYDSSTNTYVGVWDGTFKLESSSNPAWILYDLLTNTRYGLGKYIQSSQIDKASFYIAGRYCDELVDNGFGGLEPRFAINTSITKPVPAYTLIRDLASVFRSSVFWAGAGVQLTQDAPGNPVMLFNQANVSPEGFTYTGSARKDRHSVVVVTWNDPDNNFKSTPEYVDDPELVLRYGLRQQDIVAFGCSSRAQARRVGKWILYTESSESDLITFDVGLDAARVLPGEIIQIHDSMRAGRRMGGRAKSSTLTSLVTDAPVELQTTGASVFILTEDGELVERPLLQQRGTFTTLTWATPLPSPAVPNAVWIVSEPNLKPILARVMSVTEKPDSKSGPWFTITAVEHNPLKYAAIEQGIKLETPPTTIVDVRPAAPADIKFTTGRYQLAGDTLGVKGILSWFGTSPSYTVRYRRRGNPWVSVTADQPSLDIYNIEVDTYDFELTARSPLGKTSPVATFSVNVTPEGIELPEVQNLALEGTFTGFEAKIHWDRTPGANGYEVAVFVPAVNRIVRQVVLGNVQRYEYSADDMLMDGGPWRSVQFRVRARGLLGEHGPWKSLDALNPQVGPLQGIRLTGGIKAIYFQCDRPADADFAGVRAWISTDSAFVPSEATLAQDGSNYAMTISSLPDGSPLVGGTEYFVRFAGYDSFGKDALSISPSFAVTVESTELGPDSITAEMLQDEIIDTAKFAKGLEPVKKVSVVNSATPYQGVSTVMSESDGKLYRWDAAQSKYVATVPTTDITGQLTSDQIQSVVATKVTGQLTSDQIAALEAAKVTGQLVKDQIANNAITSDKIADAAITASKFGTGIEPVAEVSSVPTVRVTNTVFNKADGKLYRWDTEKTVTGNVNATWGGSPAVGASKVVAGDTYVSVAKTKTNSSESTAKGIVSVAAVGGVYSFVAKLLADTSNTISIGIGAIDDGSGGIWGTDATTTVRILSGPGVLDLRVGSLARITGLSATVPTVVEVSRSYQGVVSVSAYIYPGGHSSTVVGAANFVGPILAGRSSYKATLDAADINGTLSSAQVESLAASKITGQLSDAQLQAISAAKIAGQLVGSQIAAGALDATKFASGVEPIAIVSSLPPASGYSGPKVVMFQGKLYRYSSGAWSAAVPATDVSGQLTDAQLGGISASKIAGQVASAQIAAGSITADKFGSGLEPVTTVTSVPASKSTNLIYNSTDKKMYRWDGTKYVATVASSDISGTLNDAQLGGISASKISGAIQDSQIAGIAANKVSGQLTDSQISGVSASKIAGTITSAQIAGVEASKVTGQLTDAQLAAISGAKVTGQVPAAAIPAGSIDASKFASGIEPIATVTSVPTAKLTSTIYNTTDKKLYRWNGTAYTAAIDSADINGTISGAQIDGIAASKVTGQLSDSQLQSISAAKIAGQVVAGQIQSGAVTPSKLAGMTAGFALNADPQASDPAAWVSHYGHDISGSFITLDDGAVGRTAVRKVGGQGSASFWNYTAERIPVVGGQRYRFSAKFRRSPDADGSDRFTCRRYGPAGNYIDYVYSDTLGVPGTGEWVEREWLWTAPLTCNSVSPGFSINHNGTVGWADMQDFRFEAVLPAGLLLDGVITSTKISDGAISTPKLAAGAVIAEKIAAKTISADKLVLGTVSDNLVYNGNPDVEDLNGAGWWAYQTSGAGGVMLSRNTSLAGMGAKRLSIEKAALADGIGIASRPFAVVPGKAYEIRFVAGASSATTVGRYFRVIHGPTLDPLTGQLPYPSSVTNLVNANTAWDSAIQPYSFTWVAPEGVNWAALSIYSWINGPLTIYLDNVEIYSTTAATIIRPGSIYADSIVAGSLSATQIAAGAITAEKLAVNAVTAAKIAADAVTAANIQAGAIQTAKLAAGAVSADKIAASAVTADKLAANSVTAGKIATDAVTAGTVAAGAINARELAAGAVTTAALAAGAVTADTVAANAITTPKIAAGAVTAAQIAAGSVQATQLAAGAVTADKVAANAITADKIASNAVTAAKIVSGTITGDKIASKTITSQNLLVTPANLIPNGNFETGDVSNWLPYSNPANQEILEGTAASVPAGAPTRFVMRMWSGTVSIFTHGGSYSASHWGNDGIPVRPGEKYYVSLRVAKSADLALSDAVSILTYYRTADDTNVQPGQRFNVNAAGITSNWMELGGVVTVPAGAARMRFYIYANQITAGSLFVADMRAWRVADATIIADGAITTAKIQAEAVTANELAASSVTAQKIVGGAVTAEKIAANAVTADKLDANAVTAAKIAAGAITSDKIAANAIQSSHLSVLAKSLLNNWSQTRTLDGWQNMQPGIGALDLVDDPLGIYPVGSVLRFRSTGNAYIFSDMIDVDPAKTYRLTLDIYSPAGSPNTRYVGFYALRNTSEAYQAVTPFFQASRTFGTPTSNPYFYSASVANSGWVRIVAYIIGHNVEASEIPEAVNANSFRMTAATNKIRLRLLNYNGSTANPLDTFVFGPSLTEIGAGMIHGTQIVAESISADQIKANAVTTAKIAASAVTANELAAGSVTAAKIVAGAVTTDKLAANSVTANELAANAVTAGKVAAGAISATELAAGAVTAEKLLIKGIGAALNPDPHLQDAALWAKSNGAGGSVTAMPVVKKVADAYVGDSVLEATVHSWRYYDDHKWPIDPTKTYLLEVVARRLTGTASFYGCWRFFDQAGNVLLAQAGQGWPGTNSNNYYFPSGTALDSTWTRIARAMGPAGDMQIPANAAFMAFNPIFGYTTGGTQQLGMVRVTEMARGELIVDGAVTATKIAAGSVITDKLAASAITADKLAANSVTAVKIAAGAIETAKLAAGAVTTDKLVAQAVTADKLAVNSVTADKLAANSVTAGAIAANAVTADKIDSRGLSIKDAAGNVILAAGTPLTNTENSVLSIANPAGGSYSGPATATGAIKITLPQSWTSTMMRFRVEIYNYANGSSTSYEVGGYNYQTGVWISHFATANGDPTRVMPVRFGHDGSKCCIWIGEPTTTWQYAKVVVKDFIAGHGAITPSLWQTGWSITVDVAAPTNVSAAVLKPVPGGAMSGIDQITAGNATTFIASAAIQSAMIDSLHGNKIQANSITAGQIAANAITADKLVSGAVTADKIAANAVTATAIQAGAITAQKVAANAITSDKLLIGMGSNLVPNPEFATGDLSGWVNNGANTVVPASTTGVPPGPPALNVLRLTGAGFVQTHSTLYSAAGATTDGIPVVQGEKYLVTMTAAIKAGTAVTLARLTAVGTSYTGAAVALTVRDNIPVTTSWADYTAIITVPAGWARMMVIVYLRSSSGECYLGRLKIERISGATMIEDGGITTDKLAANSVTTAKIATGAVTANEIAANAITSAKIAAGAITANELAAGAVSADKVAADAITAIKIKAGEVTLDKLAANSVNASKIVAASITGDKLVANTITADKIAATTITGDKLAATTITGDKIAAATITAEKLAANSVTADKLSAGSVTAEKIAAGAISADKIEVGYNENLVLNAGLFSGRAVSPDNWTLYGGVLSGHGYAVTGQNVYAGNRIPNISTLELVQTDGYSTGNPDADWGEIVSDHVACSPGERFEFSCYTANHRCSSRVGIQFLNSAGTWIAETWVNGANVAGSTSILDWGRVGGFEVAPANAAFVRISLRKQATNSGSITSSSFFVCPMLARAPSGKTQLSNWKDNSNIIRLSGGRITTPSIQALAGDLGTLQVGTANIADLSVSTLKIQDRAVTVPAAFVDLNEITLLDDQFRWFAGITLNGVNGIPLWVQFDSQYSLLDTAGRAWVEIRVNGVTWESFVLGPTPNGQYENFKTWERVSFIRYWTVWSDVVTIELWARPQDGAFYFKNRALLGLGCKK